MLIKFIEDAVELIDAVKGASERSEKALALLRGSGFFVNRDALLGRCFVETPLGNVYEPKPEDRTVVYTNDETLLHYAVYADGEFKLEFKFKGYDGFIPASKLHPNLRRVNNLTIMYQKRIFHDDFEEYREGLPKAD